jgi:8-oxo-dGTP pyrophosphatase MutT (NUDIX family)
MEDITYREDNKKFNYRVAGLIRRDDEILVMKDQGLPYYYLPGGRVKFFEESKDAIAREIDEELGLRVMDSRMIWVNESFFVEELSNDRFHEICFYYQIAMDKDSYIFDRGEFEKDEGRKRHFFRWIKIDELEGCRVYPLFLAKELHGENANIKHIIAWK